MTRRSPRELERALDALDDRVRKPSEDGDDLTETEKARIRDLVDPGQDDYDDVDVATLKRRLESEGGRS